MKNILISYVVDADTEIEAVNHLKALMYLLPKQYVEKFEIFDILDTEVVE